MQHKGEPVVRKKKKKKTQNIISSTLNIHKRGMKAAQIRLCGGERVRLQRCFTRMAVWRHL